jgi:sugar phosphate isomerase/epimerase
VRIGTTSYIYPADILPNARKLAETVDDIELVLFEVDDRNNLPDAHTITELIHIAAEHDLTYTAHLPLDLRLANDDNESSIDKALKVIRHTEKLHPFGYIVHIESDEELGSNRMDRQVENSLRALNRLTQAVGAPELLCLENLENTPAGFLEALLDAAPVSRCVDIGHYWKMGVDPVPHLLNGASRTRVVHLHGVAERDHTSLAVMPEASIDAVTSALDGRFDGALTLEVFSEPSLFSSLEALKQSQERLGKRIL